MMEDMELWILFLCLMDLAQALTEQSIHDQLVMAFAHVLDNALSIRFVLDILAPSVGIRQLTHRTNCIPGELAAIMLDGMVMILPEISPVTAKLKSYRTRIIGYSRHIMRLNQPNISNILHIQITTFSIPNTPRGLERQTHSPQA